MKENRKEMKSVIKVSAGQTSQGAASTCNNSAITDYVCSENHVIEWDSVKVIDRESDKTDRLVT